jgi:hypothetical protein
MLGFTSLPSMMSKSLMATVCSYFPKHVSCPRQCQRCGAWFSRSPCLQNALLTKKRTLARLEDSRLVASRDDGKGPCSEAESTRAGVLYVFVSATRPHVRIPRGRSCTTAHRGFLCAPNPAPPTVLELLVGGAVATAGDAESNDPEGLAGAGGLRHRQRTPSQPPPSCYVRLSASSLMKRRDANC